MLSNRRMRARAGTAPEVVGAAAAVHVAAVPAVAAKSCQNHPRIPRKTSENQWKSVENGSKIDPGGPPEPVRAPGSGLT